MQMLSKVESAIFKQTLHYPLLQVVENNRCTVEHFTDDFCMVKTPDCTYQLSGINFRVKEYGDFVIRIESDGVKKIEIVGDENEK